MKWLRWEAGRQETGYDKLLLASSKWLKFDLYLLRFPENCVVPYHTDPVVPGYEHHRINIVLKAAEEGGQQVTKGETWKRGRIEKFRPDIQRHALRRVVKGKLYLMSLGWLRKSKETSPLKPPTSTPQE